MEPNPVLTELGFSPRDRVAIIHVDDIGMCQAGVGARCLGDERQP